MASDHEDSEDVDGTNAEVVRLMAERLFRARIGTEALFIRFSSCVDFEDVWRPRLSFSAVETDVLASDRLEMDCGSRHIITTFPNDFKNNLKYCTKYK